jgi:hypothetical protein
LPEQQATEASVGLKEHFVMGMPLEVEIEATIFALDQFQHCKVQSGPPVRVKRSWLSSLNCMQVYSCGDGVVKCWGKSAREVGGLYSQITASDIFMCGVLVDGRINCWGMYKFSPPQPGAKKFVQISCGATQCCTLDSQGEHSIHLLWV